MDFYYIRGPWINSVPCTGTPCREVHRKGLCAPKLYIPNTIKPDYRISSYSFRTFMYCDLGFPSSKKKVFAETT